VKPRGALYTVSARRPDLADAIARAVRSVDPTLVLYGLPGSAHAEAATSQGLRFAAEAFADRNYLADGSLVPRSRPHAMVTDPATAARRVRQMVAEGTIATVDGTLLHLRPDTVCVHGDGETAVEILRAVSREL
jgi:5-oxoprolinase (ATP-hydrolysing) subunit A